MFLCCYVSAGAGARAKQEYDSMGRLVSFYPSAMMIAKHYKPMVLFRDTKLVSIHMELASYYSANYKFNLRSYFV